MKIPNQKRPCKDCPFRKDSLKGWLGKNRMEEILNANSFVCHKKSTLQCAGHMILGEGNAFVQIAERLDIEINLSGEDLIFDNRGQCIEHHTNAIS